jgi:Matrixin/Carboxypeptidase regulatory-like domain
MKGRVSAICAITVLGLLAPAVASAAPKAISALGSATVNGQPVMVDVVVAVPRGADAHAVAAQVLAQQGARPIVPAGLGSFGFTTEGWTWNTGELPVHQDYNSTGDPTGVDGYGDVQKAETTWSGGSRPPYFFRFDNSPGTTPTCPSLVKECPGPQVFDSSNEVGWVSLTGCCTLGITWYATSPPYEADTALNTRFAWSDNASATNAYDAQTVLLHEFGHTVGLGHSSDPDAVMYATYQGVRRSLNHDDQEGVTYLYPKATTTVSGIVTSSSTGLPIAGATVTLSGTPLTDTTDSTGHYSISNVPDPVTYDITASAFRYRSATLSRQTITGATTENLQLSPKGKG